MVFCVYYRRAEETLRAAGDQNGSGRARADFVPITIWTDGRLPPSRAHDKSGYTTGVWDNDVLVTRTTHM